MFTWPYELGPWSLKMGSQSKHRPISIHQLLEDLLINTAAPSKAPWLLYENYLPSTIDLIPAVHALVILV